MESTGLGIGVAGKSMGSLAGSVEKIGSFVGVFSLGNSALAE